MQCEGATSGVDLLHASFNNKTKNAMTTKNQSEGKGRSAIVIEDETLG